MASAVGAVPTATAAAPAPTAVAAANHITAMMLHYATRSVVAFEKLEKRGEGTYGSVYRALDKTSGEVVALKKIRPVAEKSGFPLTSIREVSLLQQVHHPHIIRLREMAVGRKPENIFLVFDYCKHDLATLIDRMTRPFSEAEVKRILLQLLDATDYLHSSFIIHRDLKLSNLLIDAAGCLKLADFGLARTFTNPLASMTPRVVTLWYRAPELLFGTDKYHSAVDMWAVGCIFGELLRHRPLLPGKNEAHQLNLICDLLGTPNEKIWPGFTELAASSLEGINLPHQPYNNLTHEFPHLGEAGLDLLSRMLTYDPSKRITAEKALAHPYFQQAPLPCPEHLMPTFTPQAPQTPHREYNNTTIATTSTTSTQHAASTNSNSVPPHQRAATAQLPPSYEKTALSAATSSKKRKPSNELAGTVSSATSTSSSNSSKRARHDAGDEDAQSDDSDTPEADAEDGAEDAGIDYGD